MSSIAALVFFGGATVPAGWIEGLTSAMQTSGPDGVAHWRAGPVALGHRLLQTLPEDLPDAQPLRGGHDVVLVAEGRLDNREMLLRELTTSGRQGSGSDAKLMLLAYQAWGPDCASHFEGDFALAVWDPRRQSLFCAVDRMGACQLYYAVTPEFFACASTEEALLVLPGVSCEPDEDAIAQMLVPSLWPVDAGGSWLRDVKTLRPAHSMEVTTGGERHLTAYWAMQAGEELRINSEAQAREEFLYVFGAAVSNRLRSARPAAQMLSGGMDSASIQGAVSTGGLRAALPRTYSAISDDPAGCEETQCILELARNSQSQSVAVPSFTGMVDSADLLVEGWSRAHPRDNSITLAALMCLAASRRGERVMLHGASGDVTLLTPERYVANLLRAGRWRTAWAECAAASDHHTYLRGSSLRSLFLSNAWTAFAPGPVKASVRGLGAAQHPFGYIKLNPQFESTVRIGERLREQDRAAAARRARPSTARQDQLAALSGPVGLALGLAGFGQLGKRYGVEMRDPWADRGVVEFFLRLPVEYKVRHGWTKYLVRSAYEEVVGPRVVWRMGKEHLGWLFVRRLMDESKPFLRQTFASELARVAPYIDIDAARHRLERHLAFGHLDTAQSHDDRQYVYDVVILTLWLKRLSETDKVR